MSGDKGAGPIRLFLVDDHALFPESLARLLATDPAFALIGVEGDRERAHRAVRRTIDVLLLDYMLGDEPCTMPLSTNCEGATSQILILLVTAGLPDREARLMIEDPVWPVSSTNGAPLRISSAASEKFSKARR